MYVFVYRRGRQSARMKKRGIAFDLVPFFLFYNWDLQSGRSRRTPIVKVFIENSLYRYMFAGGQCPLNMTEDNNNFEH